MILDRWIARISAHHLSVRVLDASERGLRTLDAALSRNGRYAFICAALLAGQLVLIWSHVPWRDEWQALQIAVESPDIAALLGNLRFEGHPPLWYALLRGLAAVAGNSYALPLAATVCALPAQAAVLARAPFPRSLRVLLVCSVFFAFEFYTVSRSLTIGVTLFTAALLTWRSGWRWLFIALLPQCDFVFGLMSIALIALAWRERRPPAAALALWLASSLVAAASVVPDPAFRPDAPPPSFAAALGRFVNALGIVLLPVQWDFGPAWNSSLPLLLVPVGWLAAILFFRVQTAGDRLGTLVLFGFVAALGVLSVAMYPLANRHVMLVAVLLVGIAWIRALAGRQPDRAFTAWLTASAAIGVLVGAYSTIVGFDAAPLFAEEIERRGLIRRHWVSLSAPHGGPVTAMTGLRFEHLEKGCLQTFTRWDHRPTLAKRRALYQHIARMGSQRGSFYLLSPYRLRKMPPDVAALRFSAWGGYNGEYYFAYEVAPGRPAFAANLPPCVRGLRPFEPVWRTVALAKK